MKWVRAFYKRHQKELKYAVPDPQEAKRFAAVNAETLATHFSVLERLVEEYALDDEHIWNLDETGVSAGRYTAGKVRQPRFMPRDEPATDIKKVGVSKTDRDTVMPCVSAAGDVAPVLFVFKGAQLPFREVRMHGQTRVETLSSHLPRVSVVAMRKEGGGVDGEVFYQWALHFTEHIKDLTTGGRHVLLIYDGYRSHMTLRVLKHLRDSNVVV